MSILDSVRPVTRTGSYSTYVNPGEEGYFSLYNSSPNNLVRNPIAVERQYTYTDHGASAGNLALDYQRGADDAMSGAIGAAQGGVSAANAAAANAQSSIVNMNQYAGQAAQAAGGIGNAITNVNQAAG